MNKKFLTKLIKPIATVLLLASVMLLAMPAKPVEAQLSATQQTIDIPAGETPYISVPTRAYLSFSPNPIGLGQPLLVNVWIDVALHRQRCFLSSDTGCYQLTFTKPDGTTDVVVMRSTRPDTTSWLSYVVDQVGEWKIKFDFLGTYFPAGRWYNGYLVENSSGNTLESCYYQPDSTPEYTFTVQEELVYSWPDLGLPTDYWTRPVDWSHREWWPVMGGYPNQGWTYQGFGAAVWDELYPGTNTQWSDAYLFYPLVSGPESAHVVWKRLDYDGGISGGHMGYYGEWDSPPTPNIVYRGRAYGTYEKPGFENSTVYFYCYDIRTGEMYWEYPCGGYITYGFFGPSFNAIAPQYIAYIEPTLLEAIPESNIQESQWHTEFIRITDDTLYKFDEWTGAITGRYNITGNPGGTFHNCINGYVLGVQNLGGGNYALINWTTAGSSDNFADRIISNTSYAMRSLPSDIDWTAGLGASVSNISPDGLGAWYGTTLSIYNLYTGEMIHEKTLDHPATAYSSGTVCADHGKVAWCTQQGTILCYDMYSGNLAWQSEEMSEPWGSSGFGVYGCASAYGMYFRAGYGGLYAFDWDTGDVVWRNYNNAPPFETPYTDDVGGTSIYPGMVNVRIADGKVYIYDGEHSPQWPKMRGFSLRCINVTTGETMWKMAISGQIAFSHETSTGPISDGYLIFPSNTGMTYVFGKGKSATTVTAAPKTIANGDSVVIEGSVLDQSPAQPGTPCVAQESMGTQMEYLHLQYPIGGIWGNETIMGVPVSLDALDPNGNYIHIADVVTDGYSGTFGYMWTPELEGEYAVTATFNGDESYGSSFAQTYVGVVEAPAEASPTPTPAEPVDYMPTLYGILAAVIVAIVLGIVAVLFTLKK